MRYLVFFLIAIASVFPGYSQGLPPYKQYRTIPAVKLLNPDSTGYELKARLQKNKPIMIMIFSPECDHCKHETEEMLKNIDKYKDIQIVMATPLPLKEMTEFMKHYQLQKYPNIIVGRDYSYTFPVYYDIKNLPFHAFYNANKQLITAFEGSMSTQAILKIFGK
ncbi:MAG: redoxin domain-containing protein [Niabella sp.]|nr:redoxin domain-containing protein [Niabella sp.]